MFSQIFGKFLVEQNLITANELERFIQYQRIVKVKLGLIAVTEKFLSTEQADKINHRQATEDKKFGDIAVEQGYLTESQVERLLKLQGNPYLVFVQAMSEQGIMTLEEIENALELYQREHGFTSTDMEDLRSGDAERIVPLFVRSKSRIAQELAGVAIRTIIRLIDSEIAIDASYESDCYEFENIAVQDVEGDHQIILGMAGEGNNLLTIASTYAREEFEEMDLFAFDAICEFINCINGMYATALSAEGIQVDMLPPMYYQAGCVKADDKVLIVPVYIKNRKIRIVIAVDNEIDITI